MALHAHCYLQLRTRREIDIAADGGAQASAMGYSADVARSALGAEGRDVIVPGRVDRHDRDVERWGDCQDSGAI
jgi:hypothetical protein